MWCIPQGTSDIKPLEIDGFKVVDFDQFKKLRQDESPSLLGGAFLNERNVYELNFIQHGS